MSSVVVEVSHVTKRFVLNKQKSLKERIVARRLGIQHREEFDALQDVSLKVASGTTLGLVGHNGSGKSTLLKVIGGIISPTLGDVKRRGRLAALLELGAGFHPDLTGRENVYLNASILGMSKQEIDDSYDSIVDFSGVEAFIDTQVKFYSSGMYVRLAFAVAIHSDPDLLLVDEVLAVGDEPFQAKCMSKIREFQRDGRTIILVSHSAAQIQQLCNEVAVLKQGRVVFQGDPREGMRVLQTSYGTAIDPTVSHEASSIDEFSVLVRSVEINSSLPTADETILAGTGADVLIRYSVGEDVTPLVLNVAIARDNGDMLYTNNSIALESEIPSTIGDHEIKLTLDPIPLAGGQYSFLASVGAVDGSFIDDSFPAIPFLVHSETSGGGILNIQTSMKSTNWHP